MASSFAWGVGLLVLLAGCAVWTITALISDRVLRQQADSLGQTLAAQTATQITELVLANDLVSLNVVLSSLIADSAVRQADVFSISGETLATAQSNRTAISSLFPLPWQQDYDYGVYLAPIQLANSTAGQIRLELDLNYIDAALNNSLLLVSGVLLLVIALAVLMIRASFQNQVSFPSRLLAFSLSNIRKGEIDTCPEPENNNELSAAIRQYNATAEYLAQNAFLNNIKQLAPESDAGGQKLLPGQLEVTLLCIRLSNFSFLASTLSEVRIIALLNKFYFLCGKVSQLYNGSIVVCSEGEVVISFTQEELSEEHGFFAICAGQLLLQLAVDIGDEPEMNDQPVSIKLRGAVHCGSMLKGLYSPITQKSSLLMGSTLDQLRSLSDAAPDGSLLSSEECLLAAGGGNRVQAEQFAANSLGDDLSAYLCLEPVAAYKALLERQALQLITLYTGSVVDAGAEDAETASQPAGGLGESARPDGEPAAIKDPNIASA